MSSYALIKDGLVANVVVWDGNDGVFDDYTTHELTGDEVVGPGFSAVQGSDNDWVFTAPVIELSPEEQTEINLVNAQSGYEQASSEIQSLNEQIEDEDYSIQSEDELKSSLASWTTYRKSLRAYINAGDGSKTLPSPPDVKA
ncbi:hypothetical protein [Pantoea sp. GM_Pan_4]|uniref:hypothetical protein n=1 Tax=Pantoea sp. GM_Pan_4 TaxID=2937389 RepID=UPI002269C351|nr:hypothetical protein [Pantoea sp. GM_Pan_4]